MFLLFLILGLILLWPGLSRAQTPGNLQQQDTLTVSVSNISIDNEFSIRGLSADFPYPVVTTISVVDQQGNPVFGLADTSRWVGPDDTPWSG